MENKIQEIRNLALKDIEDAQDLKTLENVKNKYLSKNSEFNNLKKGMNDLAPEQKPIIGSLINKVWSELENLINTKNDEFYKKELKEKLLKERIDVTQDGSYIPLGHIHPLTQTVNEITDIFQNLGFSLAEAKNSPEVELEKYNFDLLNVPSEHPARDVQDTFYCDNLLNVVLRSQTSNAQARTMVNSKPPIKIISPGRVYRNENVSARKNNLFHQIEGLYVDKNVTIFSHLQSHLLKLMFNVLCVRVKAVRFAQVPAGLKYWEQVWLILMY